ncbi:MAG: Hpt domain-containing protein [Clostridiales bacterium]
MKQLLIDLEKMGCDISGSLRRFANNENMYLKYLYRFPEEDTLSKFQEALSQGDYLTAHNQIHTFKGLSGNLGFTDLYQLAQEIMRLLQEQDYQQLAICEKDLSAKYQQLIELICLSRQK